MRVGGARRASPAARGLAARTHLRVRRALSGTMVGAVRRARASSSGRPGVTVVTVTWNSLDYLRGCLAGIRRFTDPSVPVLVVDNHSTDGTRGFLAGETHVRTLRTPWNIGHGLGLDLAFACAETDVVVVLDVDAFPISDRWLSAVLDPLDAGAVIAGAYVQRAFIHPSFLAMRRSDYLRLGVGFAPRGVPTPPGGTPRGVFMDVGEALSHTVSVVDGSAALHRVPITRDSGNHLVGSVYGDVVYHNFYSTQGAPDLVAASTRAWADALDEHLGSSSLAG